LLHALTAEVSALREQVETLSNRLTGPPPEPPA
jgi:polyhydroxyalkanoate synthesis regulator phasin